MKNEKRQKTIENNGQFLIRFNGKEEWSKIFNWLTENKYQNVHNYSSKVFPNNPNVVCIDKKEKEFFGVNVTCLACTVSSGVKVIEFDELMNLIKT